MKMTLPILFSGAMTKTSLRIMPLTILPDV